MSAAPAENSLVEYFTLRGAEQAARELPAEVQSSLARGLALAAQKRQAAEVLWPTGSMAEALVMAREALEAAAAALDAARTPSARITEARAVVTAARARVAEAALPELEADVEPSHEAPFRAALDALTEVDALTRYAALGPSQVTALRRKRWIVAAALAALFAYTVVFFLRAPSFTGAVASEEWTADVAENAIDGDPKTLWALPDGHPGWIDLTLAKPRTIAAVRVAQGNPPAGDRATKDARIETFLGGTFVKGVDVTLAEPAPTEVTWTDVDIDSPACDRVRFTARTFYKKGGGLAEIKLK